MSVWSSGYVTDIAYSVGTYPHQSPWHLAMCATLSAVRCDMPGGDEPISYLELGCGLGFGATVLAAANPSWTVTAIDFNPTHIAIARRMARDADIGNIHFHEADLSSLAEDPLLAQIPEADFVSMHGVWSWVVPAVQQGIVRLLKARVKPGGVLHLSYNALPAWQGAIGMQRLVRDAGLRQPLRSDRQAAFGLGFARDLFAAEAMHLRRSTISIGFLERFDTLNQEYLAHELMNGAWQPCFHADVVETLGAAKLDWVGSANISENFPELMLDEKQRALQSQFEEPVMRELVKDMCIPRGLRSDIFIRGAQRITGGARDAALGELTLGLGVPAARFGFELEVPVGKVTMDADYYGALVGALAKGPARLRDLMTLPGLAENTRNPGELIGMLVGSGQAQLVARPQAELGAAARRLNALSARQFVNVHNLTKPVGIASTRLGGGIACTALELFLLDRIQAVGGWIDPGPWVAELAPDLTEEQAGHLCTTMTEIANNRHLAWTTAGLI